MSQEPRVRVVCVEDHYLAQLAFATLFEGAAGFELVAVTASGKQAAELVAQHRPDVVLMDLHLADGDGADATREICRRDPSAKVLAMSNFDNEDDILAVLRAGARGFLSKSASREALLNAASQIAAGHEVIPLRIAERLGQRRAVPRLSPRELQVLQLIADGQTNQEIADALGLAEGTVRLYCSTLFTKLDARRRTEAVAVALRLGLIRPPGR